MPLQNEPLCQCSNPLQTVLLSKSTFDTIMAQGQNDAATSVSASIKSTGVDDNGDGMLPGDVNPISYVRIGVTLTDISMFSHSNQATGQTLRRRIHGKVLPVLVTAQEACQGYTDSQYEERSHFIYKGCADPFHT